MLKANTFINKLTTEMAEKEPEVAKLNTEIEQLNKRLSQERINLDRASKAFRKKEAAARKKSEETQVRAVVLDLFLLHEPLKVKKISTDPCLVDPCIPVKEV